MLGNRKLVLDTMGECYKLLRPWSDAEFWDFSTHDPIDGAVYVIGRQQFIENKHKIIDMANSGKYVVVFCNAAEGSWTLLSQLQMLEISELILNKKMLVIGGAEMEPEYNCLSYEHFLSHILDYEENCQAQHYIDDIFNKTNKPYKFMFLNGRARPHRKYLYEQLKRTGALDQSLWTMLDNRPTTIRAFTLEENGVNVMATSSPLQWLPAEYEVDQYKNPVINSATGRSFIKNELFNNTWGEIYLKPEPYIDTYFSLITETVFYESNYSFRTEKIAKALAIGHPFIVASTRGFYRDLRKLGFKTFNNIIDESFDLIESPQDRADRIVEIVTDLCNQNLTDFLTQAQEVCKYNQQHLQAIAPSLKQDFPQRFAQFINNHANE